MRACNGNDFVDAAGDKKRAFFVSEVRVSSRVDKIPHFLDKIHASVVETGIFFGKTRQIVVFFQK